MLEHVTTFGELADHTGEIVLKLGADPNYLAIVPFDLNESWKRYDQLCAEAGDEMRQSLREPPWLRDWAEHGSLAACFRGEPPEGVTIPMARSAAKDLRDACRSNERTESEQPEKPPVDPVGEPKQADPSEERDGPLPGNRFCYAGKIHDLPPIPWKLLYATWGHDERNMHDVEEEIWDAPCGAQLKSATSALKKRLEKIGYPKFLSKASRSDSLIWKDF